MKMGETVKTLDYLARLEPTVKRCLYNFHVGKGGVVYHPSFFRKSTDIVFNRSMYQECCETGDDIWFNFMRIINGIDCVVIDKKYMLQDLPGTCALYSHFNMKNNLNTINIRKTATKLLELGFLKDIKLSFDSDRYWDTRYKNNGNSGDGSYGDKAQFKGNTINRLLREKNIMSIIDYGVGDGNQLKYIDTNGRKYIGLDISPCAITKCRQLFSNDPTKNFYEIKDFNTQTKADLVMSNDVIFHLIDNFVYSQYMRQLFGMSNLYVLIHSVNNDFVEAAHVKFRNFYKFVEKYYPQWKLIEVITNPLWKGRAGTMAFHVYRRC